MATFVLFEPDPTRAYGPDLGLRYEGKFVLADVASPPAPIVVVQQVVQQAAPPVQINISV